MYKYTCTCKLVIFRPIKKIKIPIIRLIWGRCYDHNFRRFFPIFGEKNWRFLKKPMLWSNFLHNFALLWVKNANFFRWIFRRKYIFLIITSVPGQPAWLTTPLTCSKAYKPGGRSRTPAEAHTGLADPTRGEASNRRPSSSWCRV
jgi:hypothetical protein